MHEKTHSRRSHFGHSITQLYMFEVGVGAVHRLVLAVTPPIGGGGKLVGCDEALVFEPAQSWPTRERETATILITSRSSPSFSCHGYRIHSTSADMTQEHLTCASMYNERHKIATYEACLGSSFMVRTSELYV